MLKCSCCSELKSKEEFVRCSSYKSGYRSLCKICKSAQNKRTYLDKADERKERQKRYRREKAHVVNKINMDRYTRKIKAKPAWLTKDQEKEILFYYSLAREVSSINGEMYHVDHIVPLNGKNVCGLHVPWNLQVLPSSENLRKSNNF